MNKFNEKDEEKVSSPLMDWEDELCIQVLDEWEKGRTYVSDLDDLYEDLYLMLRGERPEKNYDWQSNLNINKIFQVVWTAIPYLTQKIFGATPIMGVKSFDKKGKWQRQEILQFWHTFQPATDAPHTSFFLINVMWILKGLLNGVSFLKKTWHQELITKSRTEQVAVPMEYDDDGNEKTVEPHKKTIRTTFPKEDWPLNRVVNNKDIAFDWLLQPGQSIRQGRFVIERAMVDLDSLKASKIKYMNLEEIDRTTTKSTTLDDDHSKLTGKDGQDDRPSSDIYTDCEVYERVGKFPVYREEGKWIPCLDKEKMDDKEVQIKFMVATLIKGHGDKSNNVLIRFEPSDYEEINYIDLHIYFDAERWQSMGMAEPIKDLSVAINDNINSMFDEINANLMPPVVVDKFRLWDWDTMQYSPQQRWLVGGDPNTALKWKEPTDITRDGWQRHSLLDNEVQLTTVTNSMQGQGREKTATTNVMNAQLTQGKMDFVLSMIEKTGLIPSAQMDVRFAKKFAHQLTFKTILGEPFQYSEWEELYQYTPAASSVKLEYQKEAEIQQDIQIMQVVANVQNPNTPKLMNMFLGNILRNRDMPREAEMFDEDYFEPGSETGEMQMLERGMRGSTPQNQNALPMSGQEKSVRGQTFKPRMITGGK